MTPNDYQALAARSCATEYPEMRELPNSPQLQHTLHAALGISSEAGELLGAVKKIMIYNQVPDFENIKEECGDLLWYIALALSSCGYTMEEAMEDNIEKLKIRYPEKFTNELAKERLDKATCRICGSSAHSEYQCSVDCKI